VHLKPDADTAWLNLTPTTRQGEMKSIGATALIKESHYEAP
jgi:hypothetical protein